MIGAGIYEYGSRNGSYYTLRICVCCVLSVPSTGGLDMSNSVSLGLGHGVRVEKVLLYVTKPFSKRKPIISRHHSPGPPLDSLLT